MLPAGTSLKTLTRSNRRRSGKTSAKNVNFFGQRSVRRQPLNPPLRNSLQAQCGAQDSAKHGATVTVIATNPGVGNQR